MLIMTSKTSGHVSVVLSIFYSVYGQSQKLLTTNSMYLYLYSTNHNNRYLEAFLL